jgi:hypothetical protein
LRGIVGRSGARAWHNDCGGRVHGGGSDCGVEKNGGCCWETGGGRGSCGNGSCGGRMGYGGGVTAKSGGGATAKSGGCGSSLNGTGKNGRSGGAVHDDCFFGCRVHGGGCDVCAEHPEGGLAGLVGKNGAGVELNGAGVAGVAGVGWRRHGCGVGGGSGRGGS